MAKGYRPVSRDQLFLMPPDMREWLRADHPVHLVIRAVGHLDTSALHAARRTGGAGAAGYDPDMLVTVLMWGYAHQVTSSRRLEELCRTDVAFRVICGGNLPDHVTIARFRSGFPGMVAELFGQVLGLCARLGMGRLGVVALDGTKVAASAGVAANRGEGKLAELAAAAVAAHGEADAAEDALFGAGRGDEVPEEAWSPRSRDERIAAALASARAERQAAEQAEAAKAEEYRRRREAGGPSGRPPASAAVAEAGENLAKARADRAAQLARLEERYAAGQPRRGRAAQVEDYCQVRQARDRLDAARAREAAAQEEKAASPGPEVVRNITDPDSRLMPVKGGGFRQAYNAQNMISEDGLVIATEVTQDPNDMAWFEPMLAKAEQAAALITASQPPAPEEPPAPAGPEDPGAPAGPEEPGEPDWRHAGYQPAGDGEPGYDGPIGLALADSGYCSEDNIKAPGPPRLIATARRKNLEKAARGQPARPDRGGEHTRAMTDRLKTPAGITAYRHRGHIAETPHGHIKANMGLTQLNLRGKAKATAEWKFACTVHNLFKAITSGHLTHDALDALPA